MVCHIGGQLGTKVVISALRMLALYMRFNGTGIWGCETLWFREKKVCQNSVPVTFIPTAHAQQSLVAKVSKSSDRSIHQGANIQVLRHTLDYLSCLT